MEDNSGAVNGSIGLKYQKSHDGKYFIVTGIGECKDAILDIPSDYNGLPVKEIGEMAFNGNATIEKVLIGEKVEKIGSFAFATCKKLNSVIVSNSVKTICSLAFGASIALEEINLGTGVQVLEESAFRGCLALKDVYIPSSVKTIGSECFEGCGGFTIKCQPAKAPSGWEKDWNGDSLVEWGK